MSKPNAPSGSRFRRGLRLVGWNALLLLLGAALIASAGEAYLRLTTPFMTWNDPWEFVPNVGYLRPPHTEIRYTNQLDFWNVSRTNSLGFLDREPPSPERAAATCHVSIIGDSFVEAREVPIRDKFHVRLEELAPPRLNVTTSAFGITNSGQVQQLPFYDEYARRLRPKLLVLVFTDNDFTDNDPVMRAIRFPLQGTLSEPTVRRRSDGKLELSLPQHPYPSSSPTLASWAARAMKKAAKRSRFALWLLAKKRAWFAPEREHGPHRKTETLGQHPAHVKLPEGWRLIHRARVFARRELPPWVEGPLQYTRFALKQFQQRAHRDGAKLVILASYSLRHETLRFFELMSEIAAILDIPVIDQSDYILRQGAKLTDARWPSDYHWNPAGHRWAAEALLEYIEEHPAICDG